MMTRILKVAGLSALALGLSAQSFAIALNGAGSTFIYPLMSKWSYEYNNKFGTEINYQSIGSGGGIQQLTNKTVDFACSDASMSDDMITNWNDPAIKALNPDVTLPDLAITVAHRSDGSGTTNIFTDYLTRVSTKW